jgi:hypothetical protein
MAEESTTSARSAIPPPTRHSPPPRDKERPSLSEKVKDKVQGLSARAKAVKEIIGLACIPLAGAAAIQTARTPVSEGQTFISPFSLDVYTVQLHSDALAEAIAELGDSYPVLGATLDRIAALTPSATIFGVGLLIMMQIAENHGRLSEQSRAMVPVPIMSRDEMAERIIHEAREAQEGNSGNGAAAA